MKYTGSLQALIKDTLCAFLAQMLEKQKFNKIHRAVTLPPRTYPTLPYAR